MLDTKQVQKKHEETRIIDKETNINRIYQTCRKETVRNAQITLSKQLEISKERLKSTRKRIETSKSSKTRSGNKYDIYDLEIELKSENV